MSVHERRQHFRIDDKLYFEYKVLEPGNCYSEDLVNEDLLGQGGQRYLDTIHYFQQLDYELSEITQNLAIKEPAVAHYLNIINAKLDYIVRNLTLGEHTRLRSVNISLGGMAFQTKEKIKEKSRLKLIIYTKPKMIPIIINAVVVYSQYINEKSYRIALQFENLTNEQEQLLSQHIMLAQVQGLEDS